VRPLQRFIAFVAMVVFAVSMQTPSTVVVVICVRMTLGFTCGCGGNSQGKILATVRTEGSEQLQLHAHDRVAAAIVHETPALSFLGLRL
jgi:hypothetical protein